MDSRCINVNSALERANVSATSVMLQMHWLFPESSAIPTTSPIVKRLPAYLPEMYGMPKPVSAALTFTTHSELPQRPSLDGVYPASAATTAATLEAADRVMPTSQFHQSFEE